MGSRWKLTRGRVRTWAGTQPAEGILWADVTRDATIQRVVSNSGGGYGALLWSWLVGGMAI